MNNSAPENNAPAKKGKGWLYTILLLVTSFVAFGAPMIGIPLFCIVLWFATRSNTPDSAAKTYNWFTGLMLLLVVVSVAQSYLSPQAADMGGFMIATGLGFLITRRGASRIWAGTFNGLLIFGLIIHFASRMETSLPKAEDANNTNIKVVKEEASTDSKQEDKDKNGVPDEPDNILKHEISWEDPATTFSYLLRYYTSDRSFAQSKAYHNQLQVIVEDKEPFEIQGEYYNGLLEGDNPKMDSIVTRIYNDIVAKKLDKQQAAEYVVTMIQEIPYVLVHDHSCEEETKSGEGFSYEYHKEGKECLPNIPGGVQSPYEFLHNLKGDCDTRSLLAYAILTKLGISASVWVSLPYGHSVLGIGLPTASDNKLRAGNTNHYCVELTSKGYGLGMISPELNDMNNWKIALYKNF